MPTLDCGSAALIFSVFFTFMIVFGIVWVLGKVFPNWNKLDGYIVALSWLLAVAVFLMMLYMGTMH